MGMKNDQSGSHVLGILILIAVLGVIGFAGYTVMNKNSQKQDDTQNTSETQLSELVTISVSKEGERILGDGVADPTVAKTDRQIAATACTSTSRVVVAVT
jgi:hypothetical protein